MPKVLSAVVAGAVAATTVLATVPAAHAEPTGTPAATDIVGAGSDTSQFVMQDLADAYNVGKASGRLVSFDAMGTGLSENVVLKAGATAIKRPNGSGAGKGLLHGAGNNTNLDYARSSSSLNAAEVDANLWQIPFAVDGLKLAVRKGGTNAPASLSAKDMVDIYSGAKKDWSELGGSAGAIKPLIPQTGSGTRAFFISQLKEANGGVDVTLAPSVTEVQEHDAAPVSADPNAVAPFSTGRFLSATGISLADGWIAQRALYNVVRQGDLGKQWVDDIFGEDGFICSEDGRKVVEASGFEQLASTDDGGVCGEATQQTTSNFKTSVAEAAQTTTRLTVASPAVRTVQLRASVAAGNSAAAGSVEFFEGSASRGKATLAQGVASLRLTNVAAGKRTYRAVFIPADATKFTASSSSTVSVTVKAPVVKRASKVSVKVGKAVAGKRAKVAVTVRTNGAKATGVVRAFVGKKRVAQARVKAGRATFRLPKLKAGSVRLQVRYLGSPTVKASAKTVRVMVARAR